MVVRRLTAEDAEAFRALRLRGLRESPDAFGASYEEEIEVPATGWVKRLLPDPDQPYDFVLGAFDSELIGMVGFRRTLRPKMRHRGGIWGMYVSTEARGRGLGRALLALLLTEARLQPGLEQIHLTVVSTNAAALRLYQECGFESYGVEPRAMRLGDRYLDEDLMVLLLRD